MAQHTDIFDEIEALKIQRNAVILAHYYQDPDIQDLADFIGDSLQLAKAARDTDADVIVFCGALYGGDGKDPEPGTHRAHPGHGCRLFAADAALTEGVGVEGGTPNHQLVSYVNCSAEVKAVSDIICTSSNAESVIASIPDDQGILFVLTEILVPGYRSARVARRALAGNLYRPRDLQREAARGARSDTRMRR